VFQGGPVKVLSSQQEGQRRGVFTGSCLPVPLLSRSQSMGETPAIWVPLPCYDPIHSSNAPLPETLLPIVLTPYGRTMKDLFGWHGNGSLYSHKYAPISATTMAALIKPSTCGTVILADSPAS
jgi:hypothetical protein